MTTTEIPIEQRYGYVLIDTPEKKQKYAPKLKTDQHFDGRWFPCGDSGIFFNYTYRRAVPMELGYELVPLDEEFGAGCEASVGDGWSAYPQKPHCCKTPRQHFERRPTTGILAFRRKIKPSVKPDGDGWVKISDRLPKADEYPVWVFGEHNEGAHLIYRGILAEQSASAVTHWQKATVPAPPAPEPSAEEQAFEKAFAEVGTLWRQECEKLGHVKIETPEARKRALILFNAGIQFAKESK